MVDLLVTQHVRPPENRLHLLPAYRDTAGSPTPDQNHLDPFQALLSLGDWSF